MLRTIILLALLASVAHAQRAPDMATLDRGDGITKFGLDVGFSSLDDPAPYNAALRFELWGQYITRIGLGFYGAIPLSSSFGSEGRPPALANDTTSLNDIELGGLYVITGKQVSVVFRGGVGLPTGTGGMDGAYTRYYAIAPRLTDLALASGDWYVRLSISPIVHVHRFFLRGDLGFDINADGDNYHYLRLNIGAGVDIDLVALALELTNIVSFDTGPFPEEDVFHSLAFTIRFMGKHLQPFLAVGVPFDNYRRDANAFFVSAGLQVAL